MAAFVHFAQDEFGQIDVLINNSGVIPLSPLRAVKIEEWNRMIDVNIRGVLHGIAAALPVMERKAPGTSSTLFRLAPIMSCRQAPSTARPSLLSGRSRMVCGKRRTGFGSGPYHLVWSSRSWRT